MDASFSVCNKEENIVQQQKNDQNIVFKNKKLEQNFYSYQK